HQRRGGHPARLVAAEDGAGERRAGGDANEGVDRIPDAVEPGDLVDEELDEQHHAAGAEDDRVREHVQVAGQGDPAEPAGQAGDEDDGVEAQPARPAERGSDGDQLGQVELHVLFDCSRCAGNNQAGARLSRKLWMPSRPSALARMSAMRRAVSARSSAPAQNALPLPPRTIARTPSSPASAPNAAASSRISVPFMALRTSGRSSHMRATGPSRSIRNVVVMMSSDPVARPAAATPSRSPGKGGPLR